MWPHLSMVARTWARMMYTPSRTASAVAASALRGKTAAAAFRWRRSSRRLCHVSLESVRLRPPAPRFALHGWAAYEDSCHRAET